VSLCDTCKDPGFCCREIPLVYKRSPVLFRHGTSAEQMTQFAKVAKLPFLPLRPFFCIKMKPERAAQAEIDGAHGAMFGYAVDDLAGHGEPHVVAQTWMWRCPHLTPAGRCGIYETRPALCRAFEPGKDKLCVHYSPPDQGETMTKAEVA
jgi:Fe-S-cluster containining protein